MSRTDVRRGGTEGAVRRPDRGAGVRRGHSRLKPSVRSSGTLARKGRNGQGSHDRERAAEGPNDWEGESDSRLMGDMRPKIQYQLPLAFMTEGRGETPDASHEGTESPTAKRDPEHPATGESLMEEVCERENLEQAWHRVRSNQGSAGVDGRTIDETGRTSKARGLKSAPPEVAPASMAGPSTRPGTTCVSTGQPSGNRCSAGLTGRSR